MIVPAWFSWKTKVDFYSLNCRLDFTAISIKNSVKIFQEDSGITPPSKNFLIPASQSVKISMENYFFTFCWYDSFSLHSNELIKFRRKKSCDAIIWTIRAFKQISSKFYSSFKQVQWMFWFMKPGQIPWIPRIKKKMNTNPLRSWICKIFIMYHLWVITLW